MIHRLHKALFYQMLLMVMEDFACLLLHPPEKQDFHLDQDLEVAMGDQVFGVSSDQIAILVLDVVPVEIEINAALRQHTLWIAQFARQAAGVEAAGGHRRHASARFDRRAGSFIDRGGTATDNQGGQQGGNK